MVFSRLLGFIVAATLSLWLLPTIKRHDNSCEEHRRPRSRRLIRPLVRISNGELESFCPALDGTIITNLPNFAVALVMLWWQKQTIDQLLENQTKLIDRLLTYVDKDADAMSG